MNSLPSIGQEQQLLELFTSSKPLSFPFRLNCRGTDMCTSLSRSLRAVAGLPEWEKDVEGITGRVHPV